LGNQNRLRSVIGKEYNVTGFRILPRAEQGAPGMIKDYKVYVKATGFGY
jgi:beta-galactosidase